MYGTAVFSASATDPPGLSVQCSSLGLCCFHIVDFCPSPLRIDDRLSPHTQHINGLLLRQMVS
jgi:hypothetical protein